MKICLHNHLDGSERDFEGDRHTLFKILLTTYPHLDGLFKHGELDDLIEYIDSMQAYSVEVVDPCLHPFEKVPYAGELK